MKLSTLTVSLPLLCATAIAQAPGANWSMTPTGSTDPSQRRENPGAANATHMFVFGGKSGASGGSAMNDLWQFDGATWTEMTTNGATGSPPARDKAGVAWDFNRNKLIVFGGQDLGGAVLGDVWEWDPGTNAWNNITPATGPTARRFTALAYDPNTSSMLMFGGLDGAGTHLDDTWLFAGGGAWIQMSPGNVPSTRRQHHLVTRSDFGDVLLFGGQDATLAGTAKWRVDTFKWDGSDWTEIVTANAPDAQVANDAAYDLIRQRVVLACGNGTGGTPSGVISEFDSISNDWVHRPLDTGIYKVSRYFAAYIPALGKTFKASGQALNAAAPPTDTYEFRSDVPATNVASGAGCNSSAGPMSLAGDTEPWGGRSWDLVGSGFANGSLGFGVVGFGTQSTPLNTLHPAGGTGCNALVTTDAVIFLVPNAGQATWSLGIPSDTAFAGLVLNAQMLTIELTGPNISLIASTNAVAGTVGAL